MLHVFTHERCDFEAFLRLIDIADEKDYRGVGYIGREPSYGMSQKLEFEFFLLPTMEDYNKRVYKLNEGPNENLIDYLDVKHLKEKLKLETAKKILRDASYGTPYDPLTSPHKI